MRASAELPVVINPVGVPILPLLCSGRPAVADVVHEAVATVVGPRRHAVGNPARAAHDGRPAPLASEVGAPVAPPSLATVPVASKDDREDESRVDRAVLVNHEGVLVCRNQVRSEDRARALNGAAGQRREGPGDGGARAATSRLIKYLLAEYAAEASDRNGAVIGVAHRQEAMEATEAVGVGDGHALERGPLTERGVLRRPALLEGQLSLPKMVNPVDDIGMVEEIRQAPGAINEPHANVAVRVRELHLIRNARPRRPSAFAHDEEQDTLAAVLVSNGDQLCAVWCGASEHNPHPPGAILEMLLDVCLREQPVVGLNLQATAQSVSEAKGVRQHML